MAAKRISAASLNSLAVNPWLLRNCNLCFLDNVLPVFIVSIASATSRAIINLTASIMAAALAACSWMMGSLAILLSLPEVVLSLMFSIKSSSIPSAAPTNGAIMAKGEHANSGILYIAAECILHPGLVPFTRLSAGANRCCGMKDFLISAL